jgi:ankyrin repeat protein
MRATMAGDVEVVRALLAKGAQTEINDMGLTPFLVASGVGPGHKGGTGLAAQTSLGFPANTEIMELLRQHGANVNAQVTGTSTYSMRVMRAPAANEGRTALHIAALDGRTDLVRYLLANGASSEIRDEGGSKAVDMIGTGGEGGKNATASLGAAKPVPPATMAEIRSLLEKASSAK